MQNWKHFLFFSFSAVILFFGTSQIYGQRVCASTIGYQDSPYWRANFVFTGVVEKFTADNKIIPPNEMTVTDSYQPVFNSVRFAVEKNYRGAAGKFVEITSSFNFKEGEKYFVYAVTGKDGKVYQLDNGECGKPPILLEDAKDDLEYAEEIAGGKLGTQISGFVYEVSQRLGTPRQKIPLAGIEVTIKGERNSLTTRTDEKGKYIFKNIPPGEYKITASTPKDLHEKPLNDLYLSYRGVKPHTVLIGESTVDGFRLGSNEKPEKYYRHWDSYSFVFTSLSSIAGKAVDSDGKVPPQQYVWLIPKFNGKIDLDDNLRQVWTNPENGEFFFEDLPKGEYVIVVNRNNCHSNNHPEYARNFFPGVSDLVNAEIITVSENQNITLKDFRLSPPLKERWFSGTVLAADKSPLVNATVFLMNSNQKDLNECFFVNIETKTDEFGRFQLKGYEGYEYQIRASIPSFKQSSSELFSKTIELKTKDSVENIELIVDSNY
jgi:hypothetical protein